MSTPLKIIHVEDSLPDSELVEEILKRAGWDCEVKRIETKHELLETLSSNEVDIVLSDCSLPQFHGLDALRIAHAQRPELPFIFISGTIGEEVAIKSLQEGATDYVLKSRLTRLVPAIRRALKEVESRKAHDKMESQLRQARKLETLGTLAGGLAHDFKNLLQILKLNISLLPLEAHRPNAVLNLASVLDQATDRASDYMKELLVFARKTDAHLEAVDLAKAARSTTEMVRVSLPANVSLSLHVDDALPPIMADAGQLDRILSNLIFNARDAMPGGGSICISIDMIRFDALPSNFWKVQDAPYLRVRVADTGTGMDEETQSHIFEPFFTTKAVGKGTGLGLSVVFGLMESHQGLIEVESAPGKGTIFTLFFPASNTGGCIAPSNKIVSSQKLLGLVSRPAPEAESA